MLNSLPLSQLLDIKTALCVDKDVLPSPSAAQGKITRALLAWLNGPTAVGIVPLIERLSIQGAEGIRALEHLLPHKPELRQDVQQLTHRLTITLGGNVNDVDDDKIYQILEGFRAKGNSISIHLDNLDSDSLNIHLVGDPEALETLKRYVDGTGNSEHDSANELKVLETSSVDPRNPTNSLQLQYADLGQVTLIDTTLRGADLTGADLRGADLRGADLTGATLTGADLSRTNLRGTNFRGAILKEATLRGADLIGADLTGADLKEATLREACLIEADLSGANLFRVNLIRADFREATLNRVYFRRANLREADLFKVNLIGANLIEADLRRAKNLIEANLIGADLSRADLRRTDLSGANLRGANLREANFFWADLRGANLSRANLYSAALLWANLEGTVMTGASGLSEIDITIFKIKGAVFND